MIYCTVLTCPELYFDNTAVNCMLVLGMLVTLFLIVRGIARFVKTFFN